MSQDKPQIGDMVAIRSNSKATLFTARPAATWAGVTFRAEPHASTGMGIKLREGMHGRIIDIETSSDGALRYWVQLPEHKSHTPLWGRQIRTTIREVSDA